MASLRTPSIRYFLSGSQSLFRNTQRRHARVHDVRFLATHREPLDQRILEKYREKLEQKAKDEGLSSPEALKEAYADKIARLKREAAALDPTAALSAAKPLHPSPAASPSPSSPFPSPPPAPSPVPSPQPGIKPLSSYLDLPKLSPLPADQIAEIWRLRHASNPLSLTAVIPTSTYNHIASTARKHPHFILPLPRPANPSSEPASSETPEEAGTRGIQTDIHFLQFSFPSPTTSTLLFTHLAEYKLRGEFSTPHTTVTHYTDLAESKGVVLLRGEVVKGRGVSVEEARWLLMCLQKFYGPIAEQGEGKRRELLRLFGEGGEGFKLEELVEEAEKIP